MTATLRLGDSLAVLPTLDTASVDAIVTDPPYGLDFMGRSWDAAVPGTDIWAECLRVLKPGGHLLAFGGTRTAHRLACAVEDAGFEIRDTITWLYGSGFPKSLDVSKAIDRVRDEDAEPRAAVCRALRAALTAAGRSRREIDEHFGTANVSQYWFSPDKKSEVPPVDKWQWLRAFLGIGTELDAEVWRLNGRKGTPGEAWGQREVIGISPHFTPGRSVDNFGVGGEGTTGQRDRSITAPATPAAEQWQGWGTALKPAQEPIIVARKPLAGTVAATVLAHGTGAINVDACRVATDDRLSIGAGRMGYHGADGSNPGAQHPGGRWPANVVLTHLPECETACGDGCPVAELDAQSGTLTSGANPTRRGAPKFRNTYGEFAGQEECTPARGADSGGASRFFPTFRYQAKAPARERPRIDGKGWPTVKPLQLMRWLVRLVTPPGGLVLDPFAGTGPTLQAAELEGFRSLGIERDVFAYELACQRLGLTPAQVAS